MAIDEAYRRQAALLDVMVSPDGYMTNVDRVEMVEQYPAGIANLFLVTATEDVESSEDITRSLRRRLSDNAVSVSDSAGRISRKDISEAVRTIDWLKITKLGLNNAWDVSPGGSTPWSEGSSGSAVFNQEQ